MPIKITEEHYLVTFKRMREEFASLETTKRRKLTTSVDVLDDHSLFGSMSMIYAAGPHANKTTKEANKLHQTTMRSLRQTLALSTTTILAKPTDMDSFSDLSILTFWDMLPSNDPCPRQVLDVSDDDVQVTARPSTPGERPIDHNRVLPKIVSVEKCSSYENNSN
jgi:hypothetical protein